MRLGILILAAALPGGVRAQVIGYDSATGAPLDPAVIGAPPIRTEKPVVESKKTSKPSKPARKKRRSAASKKKTPLQSRPAPKERRHLHGIDAEAEARAADAPGHVPADRLQDLVRRSENVAVARQQRMETLDSKIRQVKSQLRTNRRGRYRPRSR